jgi:N-acetylglucosamine kinase-like BadF-type ATPase
MTDYFLGVDGGGTKTAFLIIDGNGTVCGRHEEGSSYHLQIGMSGLHAVLYNGATAAIAKAGLTAADVTHAFFGLPAYGEDSRVQAELDAMPAAILGHTRYSCGNDMVCGWAGSLACADGINIVAGTGSIGYGECNGRTARVGGWGELFGDEGSAYWIAVQGLNAFSRMADGRQPKGALYALVRSELTITHDLDLSGLMTGRANSDRDTIAAVSRIVAKAAALGDRAALDIFRTAAHELAAHVTALAYVLQFDSSSPIPVSYSGGVFNAGQLILEPFKQVLQAQSAPFRLVKPDLDPTTGAALYAAKLSGTANFPSLIDYLKS